MIDSINFKTKIPLKDLDLSKVENIQSIYDRKRKNYTIGIRFEYKCIRFQYYGINEALLIRTNTHVILKKKDITLSDYTKYINKVNDILNDLFDIEKYNIRLSRLDYCVDLNLGEEKIREYLSVLKRSRKTYKYMKMKSKYKSSIYLKTKQGKRNINMYDRGEKTKNNKDKGVFRIELQQKEAFIKKYGISLKQLWSSSSMNNYFFDFLRDYFFEGDYYKISKATEIIDTSDLRPCKKKDLKTFLVAIMKSESISKVRKFSKYQIKNRIVYLNKLKINPLSIPENSKYSELDNLLNMAYKVATAKYFDIG